MKMKEMNSTLVINTSSPLPPPPPPPPMPHEKNQEIGGQPNIDLIPVSAMKPSMKMRTLNWRRIPKKKILSQDLDKTTVSAQYSFDSQQRRDSSGSTYSTLSCEAVSDENKNLWFLIAMENNSIKRAPPSDTSTTSNGSASKSASMIREMLESVRRRMAATKINSELFSASPPTNEKQPRNILGAIDFDHLESLFCLNSQPSDHQDSESPNFIRRSSMRTNASSDSMISNNSYFNDSSNNGDDDDSLNEFENILDSKKSLNVNIFLKQLKSTEDLIDLINKDLGPQIGKDRLEGLLRLLPDKVEENQLMRFHVKNKQNRLPVAERFLLQLITQVSNLKLRIKFMLLQEEYNTDMEAITPELDKIEKAAEEIRSSKMLRDLLNLVLITGNFLNAGGYAADAAGFSLDCLDRLSEIRSNKSGIYLIHYVAEVASKMDLINFQRKELPNVEPASRVCTDSIRLDLNTMMDKITELKRDIEAEGESGDKENQLYLLHLMRTLDDIKSNVEFLKRRTNFNLEDTRKQLAKYLCEDPDLFKLHDCFNNLLAFSRKLKSASEENERRQKSELSRLERSSCSLRRSNTINPRLMKAGQGRLSLGDPHQNEPTFFPRLEVETVDSKLVSRMYNLKKTQSNLTRTTSTFNMNEGSKAEECDDLHQGLMNLLIDSNNRRASDIPNRNKINAFGTYRRTGKLLSYKAYQ